MINNLAELRKQKGLTQAELAKKIERSAGYISLLENGRIKLSDELKTDISSALGCRIDEIRDYHDSRCHLSEKKLRCDSPVFISFSGLPHHFYEYCE